MKHQQVNVDYWAMLKAMVVYGALTALVWLMLRLFNTVFTLPRRLRAQQENMQNSLAELQRRFPDLNLTEEDLKNAEQELDALVRERGDIVDRRDDDDDDDDDDVMKKAVTKPGESSNKNIEIKKTV